MQVVIIYSRPFAMLKPVDRIVEIHQSVCGTELERVMPAPEHLRNSVFLLGRFGIFLLG